MLSTPNAGKKTKRSTSAHEATVRDDELGEIKDTHTRAETQDTHIRARAHRERERETIQECTSSAYLTGIATQATGKITP